MIRKLGFVLFTLALFIPASAHQDIWDCAECPIRSGPQPGLGTPLSFTITHHKRRKRRRHHVAVAHGVIWFGGRTSFTNAEPQLVTSPITADTIGEAGQILQEQPDGRFKWVDPPTATAVQLDIPAPAHHRKHHKRRHRVSATARALALKDLDFQSGGPAPEHVGYFFPKEKPAVGEILQVGEIKGNDVYLKFVMPSSNGIVSGDVGHGPDVVPFHGQWYGVQVISRRP